METILQECSLVKSPTYLNKYRIELGSFPDTIIHQPLPAAASHGIVPKSITVHEKSAPGVVVNNVHVGSQGVGMIAVDESKMTP